MPRKTVVETPPENQAVKPTEDELAAHEAEKRALEAAAEAEAAEAAAIDPVAPEAVAVKDDPVPDEPEPEPEPVADDWFVGKPCLNCGARDYKWTVGWGASCSQCAPENQIEEDTDGDD